MKKNIVGISKDKTSPRLLAVDPSLTQSGWALFSLDECSPVLWGVITGGNARQNLQYRIAEIQSEVLELMQSSSLGVGDFIVCEGPAPITLNPSSALKVEQVRGVFEAVARSFGVMVPGRLNPRTIQSELLGLRGKQLARKEVKHVARCVASSLFSSTHPALDEQSQDIIDACLVGALAHSRIKRAVLTGTSVTQAFAEHERGARKSNGRGMRWSSLPSSRLK